MSDAKIWLIKFPVSQYKEDVKSLARKEGLTIYDAKFKEEFDAKFIAKKTPKLTLKTEKKTEKKTVTIEPEVTKEG